MIAITDKQSASAFAENLHGLMVSLTTYLKRETEALHKGAYAQATMDQETKAEMIHAYRKALEELVAHKDLISRHVPVKLDELRRLNEAFQAELTKNLATVSTAKAVSEHLLTQLADQVSVGRQPKTYGANGAMNTRPRPASISVDRAL